MKKYLSVLALLLFLTGCGEVWSNLKDETKTVTLEIQKSPENKETFTLSPEKNLSEAMTLASIAYQTSNRGDEEVMFTLSGVIATKSRNWNLYINDERIRFTKLSEVTIKPGDKINWQYETNP